MDSALKIIALFFVFAVVYDRYTPFRLWRRKKYSAFPSLKQSVTSGFFEIKSLGDVIIHAITFDSRYNYFLLARSQDFVKLNARGQEVGRLPRKESHELPAFSHYVVDTTGIYDLSQEKIRLETFTAVLNADRMTDPFQLRIIIKQLYSEASTVLFSKELAFADGRGYCIYFNINSRWTKLYTEKNASQLNAGDHYREEIAGSYRSRYFRLAPLKDVNAKVYSDHTREGDWYNVNPDDYTRSYKNNAKLTTLFFEREQTFGTIPFTTIPISWICQAYYKLSYRNEQFFFQAKTVKTLSRRAEQYYLRLELPEVYQHLSPVWFLVLDYPFSISDDGSEATYIVKPS